MKYLNLVAIRKTNFEYYSASKLSSVQSPFEQMNIYLSQPRYFKLQYDIYIFKNGKVYAIFLHPSAMNMSYLVILILAS